MRSSREVEERISEFEVAVSCGGVEAMNEAILEALLWVVEEASELHPE